MTAPGACRPTKLASFTAILVTTTGATFGQSTHARVYGKTLSAPNTIISGVTVRIVDDDGTVVSTMSGEAGVYDFASLTVRHYHETFTLTGDKNGFRTATTTVYFSRDDSRNIDLLMAPLGVFEARLVYITIFLAISAVFGFIFAGKLQMPEPTGKTRVGGEWMEQSRS